MITTPDGVLTSSGHVWLPGPELSRVLELPAVAARDLDKVFRFDNLASEPALHVAGQSGLIAGADARCRGGVISRPGTCLRRCCPKADQGRSSDSPQCDLHESPTAQVCPRAQ